MTTTIETNFVETRGMIESILGMDMALKAKNERLDALEAELAELRPVIEAAQRFVGATSLPDGGEFADMSPSEIADAHDALHEACARLTAYGPPTAAAATRSGGDGADGEATT